MNISDIANKVWDILVAEAGADDRPESTIGRRGYVYDAVKHNKLPQEWRFMGNIGFGGKVRFSTSTGQPRVYIDCYREEESPATLAILKRTNERLAAEVSFV